MLLVFFTKEDIEERVRLLGEEISSYYRDKKEVVVIGVLNGSFMFLADLVRHFTFPCTIDFIGVSSYKKGEKSTGKVTWTKKLSVSIKRKHVLIVEDIVDSGLTLSVIWKKLQKEKPASLSVVTFLSKYKDELVSWYGFRVGDYFVYGYGLDWKGKDRNLYGVIRKN